MSASGVSIELTEGQLREIRAALAREEHPPLPLDISDADLERAASGAQLAGDSESTISASLVRGLLVLNAFQRGSLARSVSEVAKELRLARGSVQIYIRTLVALGFLVPVSNGRMYRRPQQKPPPS